MCRLRSCVCVHVGQTQVCWGCALCTEIMQGCAMELTMCTEMKPLTFPLAPSPHDYIHIQLICFRKIPFLSTCCRRETCLQFH